MQYDERIIDESDLHCISTLRFGVAIVQLHFRQLIVLRVGRSIANARQVWLNGSHNRRHGSEAPPWSWRQECQLLMQRPSVLQWSVQLPTAAWRSTMMASRPCLRPRASRSLQRNPATMQSRCRRRRRGVVTAQALLRRRRALSRWARRLPGRPRGRRRRRRSSTSLLPRRRPQVALQLVALSDTSHVSHHSAAIAKLPPHLMQATRLGRRL